jgi:hypothetical protein
LLAERAEIERDAGFPFEWEELPNRKESRVAVRRSGVNPADRSNWTEQHSWMIQKLEALHRVFSHRVRELDATSELRTATGTVGEIVAFGSDSMGSDGDQERT